MLHYYTKLAIRHFRAHPFIGLVNVLGLGVGLIACLLIIDYLSNEWNYDTFHSDYEQIYRVKQQVQREGIMVESASSFSMLSTDLKESYPTIEQVCRIHKIAADATAEYEQKRFRERKIMGVDSSFFQIFNFDFIQGDPKLALQNSKSVVITQSMAEKYFGDADPIDQQLVIDGAYGFWGASGYESRISYTVTGVIADLPANTHLEFDFLISFSLYTNLDRELKNWGDSFYTYLKIKAGEPKEVIEKGLASIAETHRPNQDVSLALQAMQQIHLTSDLVNEVKANGNKKMTWLLGMVAFILLLVAGTNHINFSIAQVLQRQEDVDVKRILGVKPRQLFLQSILEAFFINGLALSFALAMINVGRGHIQQLLGFELVYGLHQFDFWLIALAVVILSTLIAGLYPALFVAQLPAQRSRNSINSTYFSTGQVRQSFLVFQFSLSMLVMGCAIILYQQLAFMQQKDLGINLENTLVIDGPTTEGDSDSLYRANLASFKLEALRDQGITQASWANFVPGKEIRGTAKGYVRKVGDPEEEAQSYSFTQIDFDFLHHFDITLLAGRFFKADFQQDRQAGQSIIINKEACRLLGFASPAEAIGQQIIYRMNSRPTIVGVIDDFHQYALQRSFQPILFELNEEAEAYCHLRLATTIDQTGLMRLKRTWDSIFPTSPFNYFFLDDFYAQQYQRDQQFMKTFGLFSILAIFIATLGFFGLIYYSAVRQTKTIGIHKIVGAGQKDIFFLLSRGLAAFIIVASLISIPIMYYFSSNWLANYAFRISIEWWMFLAPIGLLTALACFVVLLQSWRSYRLNPVSALRED